MLGQRRLCQVEKGLVVVLEGVRGERLEAVAQGLVEQATAQQIQAEVLLPLSNLLTNQKIFALNIES